MSNNGWARFATHKGLDSFNVESGRGRTVRSEWARGWLDVSVTVPIRTWSIGRVEGVYDAVALLVRAYDDGVSTRGILKHFPRSEWWQVPEVLKALVQDKKVGRVKSMYWVPKGSRSDPGVTW